MSLINYKELLKKQGLAVIRKSIKAVSGDIFCEALNSNNIWDKIRIWYDGTGKTYPEETWNLVVTELEEGATVWKAIRMIKNLDGRRTILKVKVKSE